MSRLQTLLRQLCLICAWSLVSIPARGQYALTLRERALRVESERFIANTQRAASFSSPLLSQDTVLNTCRGKPLVGRLLGTAAAGALMGWLMYGLVQASVLGGANPILRGRMVIGGAVAGAGVTAVQVALKKNCELVLRRR